MKFTYIFVNHNNGHKITYHPFVSNSIISQEFVNKLLETIPSAHRLGTCVEQLLEKLDEKNITFSYFECPCCKQIIHSMYKFSIDEFERIVGREVTILEGISGNY
jgi:hypothetical protein